VIVALFTDTFTASEGAEEGRLIGALVRELLASTPAGNLHVFCAEDDGALAGCILFTRLRYDGDARQVFLLAPVAVAPDHQRQGVGQALIAQGLDALRQKGLDVAMTYGDPAYYGKTGFRPVTVDQAAAPQPLSQPEGWLAQSLDGDPLIPLRGAAQCVPAFDRPEYW